MDEGGSLWQPSVDQVIELVVKVAPPGSQCSKIIHGLSGNLIDSC